MCKLQDISYIMDKCAIKQYGACSFKDVPVINGKLPVPQNAKTVITTLFPYDTGYKGKRNISKYAAVPDYHAVAAKYLKKAADGLSEAFPEYSFLYYCDHSPINEVKAAALSGLGVIGSNGLLINKKFGSFVFLGEIITDMLIECEKSKPKTCKQCGNCELYCPTIAINAKAINDKSKCVSAITQKKGELSEYEKELIKIAGLVWGCDICQNVCPMNKNAERTTLPEFTDDIKPIFTPGDSSENRTWAWRGEEVVLRNYDLVNSG